MGGENTALPNACVASAPVRRDGAWGVNARRRPQTQPFALRQAPMDGVGFLNATRCDVQALTFASPTVFDPRPQRLIRIRANVRATGARPWPAREARRTAGLLIWSAGGNESGGAIPLGRLPITAAREQARDHAGKLQVLGGIDSCSSHHSGECPQGSKRVPCPTGWCRVPLRGANRPSASVAKRHAPSARCQQKKKTSANTARHITGHRHR